MMKRWARIKNAKRKGKREREGEEGYDLNGLLGEVGKEHFRLDGFMFSYV